MGGRLAIPLGRTARGEGADMARKRPNVRFHEPEPAQIPEALVPGALLLTDLEARGVIDKLAEKLKIRRQGGFAAVDVFLVVLLFLASDVTEGLRPFWARLGAHLAQVAALAGRKRLPSPASVSRALNSVGCRSRWAPCPSCSLPDSIVGFLMSSRRDAWNL